MRARAAILSTAGVVAGFLLAGASCSWMEPEPVAAPAPGASHQVAHPKHWVACELQGVVCPIVVIDGEGHFLRGPLRTGNLEIDLY